MMDARAVDPYREKYIEDVYVCREDGELYRRVVKVKARNKEEALECLRDLIRAIHEDLDIDNECKEELTISTSVLYEPIAEERNPHEDIGDIGQALRETGE